MLRKIVVLTLGLGLVAGVATLVIASEANHSYKVVTTAIEACSCPPFCSCYYNEEPSGGHMCQFNNAYRFEEGSHWGDVDLSNVLLWVSGDLGSHYGDGTTEWAVVSFDKKTTEAQRAAINAWMDVVFPVEWGKVEAREDEISWEEGDTVAHAAMASGLAEIKLNKVIDPHGEQSVVMNTPYWASSSNTGFRLAHSTHHFDGDPSYSYEGRNGFLITFTTEGTIE